MCNLASKKVVYIYDLTITDESINECCGLYLRSNVQQRDSHLRLNKELGRRSLDCKQSKFEPFREDDAGPSGKMEVGAQAVQFGCARIAYVSEKVVSSIQCREH